VTSGAVVVVVDVVKSMPWTTTIPAMRLPMTEKK